MKLNKVHEDNRRSIHVVDGLLPDKKEFSFILLKEGKAIGGCSHLVKEYYMIIKGAVDVLAGEDLVLCYPGGGGSFDAGVIHGFIAHEDSIIAEWGVTAEEKNLDQKDETMRNYLNNINDTSI